MLLLTTAVYADGININTSHGGLERLTWMFDGRTNKTIRAPVVLALHGYRKPEQAKNYISMRHKLGWHRLEDIAKKENFVAVFPAAYRGQWSLVPGLKNLNHENGKPIDDEDFLLTLIARLIDDGIADPSRLYITGISDGAIMTHRMICLKETPFAAAATLIGTAHENHIADCKPSHPPALMQVHGDNDQVLPYEGWIFKTGREISVAEVMDHWRRLHGCTGQDGKRLEDIDKNDGNTVLQIEWTGCTSDPNVLLFKIKGGGHSVPALDATQRIEPKRKINRDLDTMTELWQFVSSARRN